MEGLQALSGGEAATAAPAPVDDRPVRYPLSIPKPIIAAINGPCAGIGLALALMFDIRFAAAEAKFTTAFARRGLVAEHGIAWMLPAARRPRARARPAALRPRRSSAGEAAELGVVNRAVDGDVLERGARVRDRAGRAVLAGEHGGDEAAGLRRPRARARRGGRRGQPADGASRSPAPDFAEGVQSFVERRPPQFAPLAAAPAR